jgi:Tfp pilus assembly protein PilN
MRPVNLIPPEDRRGDQAPLRTGPLAYILIGGLVLVLAGVVALVLTGNQVAERKHELVTLKREDAVAKAKAARLASYSQFQSVSEARVQTVQSLADSRFDWERVLRELALILPSDVHLTALDASSGGTEGGGSEKSGESFADIHGPSMTMSGCADGQDGVAAFVTALKDIEGVTRVGLQSSQVSGEGGETAGLESSACSAAPHAATFALVVAFDAAPVPASEGEEASEPASESSSEGSEGSSESSGESSEGS